MLPVDYQVATPVSHHFGDRKIGSRLVALSDVLELRDGQPEPPAAPETAYIYHAEANAAGEWTDQQRSRMEAIQSTYDPDLVSLHLTTRYPETDVVDDRFVGVGDPYDRAELRTNVQENIEDVEAVFGDVPILLENNNHLGTDAYDVITDPSFIDTVIKQTDTGLLLDIAHAKITAWNTGSDLEGYTTALPLDRCRQVHLSRHGISPTGATDDHEFLHQSDWAYFDAISENLPALTYVTLEYYTDATVLIDQLERMQTGTSTEVVAPEDWDSEFFDRSIASVTSEPTTAECLDYALVRCCETEVDVLYFETEDDRERDAAKQRGFELVDTKLVFEWQGNKSQDQPSVDSVRPWRQADMDHLTDIAGSIYHETRFYNDARFSDERCDELYETWIENACHGYADEVLVAVDDGRPVGFISCTCYDDHGDIGLVGVAETEQGSGIGTKLATTAIGWFQKQGLDRVTVETQANNDAAIQLYRAVGFSRRETRYVLHRWFDRG